MKTLYITDLDGTLLGKNTEISDFTLSTVNSFVDNGGCFTIATARSIGSARMVVPTLKTNAPAVLMNGVFLTDLSAGKALEVYYFPENTVRQALNAFLSEGHFPNVYYFKNGRIEVEVSGFNNAYERDFFAARKKMFLDYNEVVNYRGGDRVVYMNAVGEHDRLCRIADRLSHIGGVSYVLYADNYSDYYFLEAFSDKANKKSGIERLRALGYDRIVAFGDNYNDLGMFEAADVAVAVGNACDDVKSAADIVIGENYNDGVAKFLLQIAANC